MSSQAKLESKKDLYLSFIIPVMNEEKNVKQLHKEVCVVGQSLGKSFEIIFVDDGSTDATYEELTLLEPVRIIKFRKNFGQTAALDAGIKIARGNYLVTLDGDLQNDPADVPAMITHLEKSNVDFVCGWRVKRHDSLSKRIVSKGAKLLRSFLVHDGIKDSGCTLRVYKRECFNNVTLRGEMHRFIPAILQWRGFAAGEIPVNHRARVYGRSKYNLKRTVKAFLDMLSIWFFRKYANRPLHFLGAMGISSALIGMIMGIWLLVARLFFAYSLSDRIWPLAAVFLILFGLQMFISGLIMDLILQSKETVSYYIKSVEEK